MDALRSPSGPGLVAGGSGPTQARRLVRSALFPVLLVALGAWAVFGSTLELATSLGLPVALNDGLVLLVTMASAYASIALLERALPYRAEWNRSHGDTSTDTLHLLLSGPCANSAFQATLGGVAVAGAAWLSTRLGHGIWPAHWPALLQLALALWVAEFGHYWFHRLAHERPLLWRLHAAHHSAPRLYWLNATRFHPLDLFALVAFESTPLLLLGIDRRALLMYLMFRVVYGELQHCNIDLASPGPLNWLFSSHELHRWHHSRDPREGDTNYASTLSFWDLLFGTYFCPRSRSFDGRVGIRDLPDYPRRYVPQLLAPFRWARVARGQDGARAARATLPTDDRVTGERPPRPRTLSPSGSGSPGRAPRCGTGACCGACGDGALRGPRCRPPPSARLRSCVSRRPRPRGRAGAAPPRNLRLSAGPQRPIVEHPLEVPGLGDGSPVLDHGALEDVQEFPDVSRPRVGHQHRQEPVARRRHGQPEAGPELSEAP